MFNRVGIPPPKHSEVKKWASCLAHSKQLVAPCHQDRTSRWCLFRCASLLIFSTTVNAPTEQFRSTSQCHSSSNQSIVRMSTAGHVTEPHILFGDLASAKVARVTPNLTTLSRMKIDWRHLQMYQRQLQWLWSTTLFLCHDCFSCRKW